jgi:hypothetical protein
MVSRYYAGMSAGESVGATTASSGATTYRHRRRPSERRFAGTQRRERRAKTKRLVIVVSLFLALLAGALLVGVPAALDPLLRAAAVAQDANRVGEIVLRMPDGAFCRHLSFDNKTAELTESAVERCEQARSRGGARATNGFVWRTP